MEKNYFIKLAHGNKRLVFGVDLFLKKKTDYREILLDGIQMGKVIQETSQYYQMPLGIPYMDLSIEKQQLAALLGIPPKMADSFHFDEPVDIYPIIESIQKITVQTATNRLKANCDAITWLKNNTELIPVGMCIGPFSLLTKLLADPISPVFLASMGIQKEDDTSVFLMEKTLQLSLEITMKSILLQIEAGAEVICVCEPAANTVYISPDTLQEASEDIFDRLIIEPNKKITQLIQKNDRQLIFHDCGELTDLMLKKICILNPQVLSLGSSRDLAKDASIVPDNIVLLGNLPSKEFFQKDRLSVDEVERLTCELQKNMIATKHPFILASECDVLSVKGSENIIQQKVDKMMNCNCHY